MADMPSRGKQAIDLTLFFRFDEEHLDGSRIVVLESNLPLSA
jgi:hypothetical protein